MLDIGMSLDVPTSYRFVRVGLAFRLKPKVHLGTVDGKVLCVVGQDRRGQGKVRPCPQVYCRALLSTMVLEVRVYHNSEGFHRSRTFADKFFTKQNCVRLFG